MAILAFQKPDKVAAFFFHHLKAMLSTPSELLVSSMSSLQSPVLRKT